MADEQYIDIRLKVTLGSESFGDGGEYLFIEEMTPVVTNSEGVDFNVLYSLYESFGQSDRWQEWLQAEIPEAIREHAEELEGPYDGPTETYLSLPAFTADRGGIQYDKN